MVDERRCHAHHSSNDPSTKGSSEQVLLTNCESNPRPIKNGCTRSALEHSSSSASDLFEYAVLSIFDFHYLAQPVQNEGLLRKLYIEMDLSSYQISEISGWSRTSISDAMRTLKIEKDERKASVLAYGERLQGTTRVVHKGEQKVINKMLALLDEGQSFSQISKYLNNEKISTKRGGSWHPSTVKEIIKREQKRKV